MREQRFSLIHFEKLAAKLKPNNFPSRYMKWVTFAVAFLLTVTLVIAGVLVYSEVLGKAATANNEYFFAFFLGPFFFVLFFAWMGEKLALRLWKKKSGV